MKQLRKRPVFLSADWHNLLFANYVIDPKVLTPFVPEGTNLNYHNGSCYISVVAFQFLNTKVFGFPAFTNRKFAEINLRFYVKRRLPDGSERSGVVFVKEIVPSRLIAWTARTLYGENYIAMDMDHQITAISNQEKKVIYRCGVQELSNRISAVVSQERATNGNGTLEAYITEHYWGYSGTDQNSTVEYEVKHPKWPVNRINDCSIDFDFESLYGTPFRLLSEIEPTSVLYCKGSDITVHFGAKVS